MTRLEEGNVTFIKKSGILYVLSLLGMLLYAIFFTKKHSGGGGSHGGGLLMIGLGIVVVAVVLTVLNYFFSKPKSGEKFLLFLPILILIYLFILIGMRLTITYFERLLGEFEGVNLALRFIPSIILIITEVFLIKYILSKSKLSTSKKYFLLLPVLIFVAQYIVKMVLLAFFLV